MPEPIQTRSIRFSIKDGRAVAERRQRLLACLIKLNSALDSNYEDLITALKCRFCESLIDYLSMGHFRILPRVNVFEHDRAALDAITSAGMRFNDRFGGEGAHPAPELKHALEHLALLLETRFEIEDQLIAPQLALTA